MTKKEKIQEVYGEYWCEEIDADGWYRLSIKSDKKLTDYMLNNKDLFESKVIKKPDWYETYFRPKSLQGIENNNGWIKIESEADLPKDKYGMYHVVAKENFFCEEPKNQGIDDYWLNDNNKAKNWIKDFSHYQPIVKPQPPLH